MYLDLLGIWRERRLVELCDEGIYLRSLAVI